MSEDSETSRYLFYLSSPISLLIAITGPAKYPDGIEYLENKSHDETLQVGPWRFELAKGTMLAAGRFTETGDF